MKFLSKSNKSKIFAENIVYQKNAAENNAKLKEKLFNEQKCFCAYTERFVEIKECEVEHFNNSLKYNDNYFNYYCVLREANLRKRSKENFIDANSISLFFQNYDILKSRINYNKEIGEYETIDIDDIESDNLINLLGFNDFELKNRRINHIKRLKRNKIDSNYSTEQFLNFIKDFKQDNLSFVTAIESEFDIDLSLIINNLE